MEQDKISITNSANDNENVVNEFYLDWLRKINNGNFKAYLNLGLSYEKGYGVRKDLKKALNAYEKYYEAYRKLVPSQFDVIKFLINIGNNYKTLGKNSKAAEWYMHALMHIVEENKNALKQQKIIKRYKLEELFKEVGEFPIL